MEGPGQRKTPDPAFISEFGFSRSGCCELQHSVGYKGNTWGWGTGKERRIEGRNREMKEGENQTRDMIGTKNTQSMKWKTKDINQNLTWHVWSSNSRIQVNKKI